MSFAVASLRLHDLPFITQHTPELTEDNLVQSLRRTISDTLPGQSEIYHVEADQLFIVVSDSASESVLQSKLFELNEKLNLPVSVLEKDIKLSCAIAYAIAPFDGSNSDELLLNLRAILSPEVGKKQNILKFDGSRLANKKRQMTIQNSIKQALEQDQFHLYFQPKVHLASGKVGCAEILMRWQHQELGWVSPTEFINLSELDGQIEQIGSWLLDKSIRQFAELKRRHGDLECLAINVSARQLSNHRIVDQLAFLLDKYQVEAHQIELEVTESSIMENIEQASNLLWQLKLLGLRIAIDDFGTGYSSFAYLAKLPIDVLKLDKVLLDDLVDNKDVETMLASLVDLCHQMQIQVVAEGAESEHQVEVLRRLGCDFAQGFVFSKAVSQSDFERQLISQPFCR